MSTESLELPAYRSDARRPAGRSDRELLFREPWSDAVRRWILGTVYALRPVRVANLPPLALHCALDMLRGGTRIPDSARTRARPDTFAGVCRGIDPDAVLAAARAGFFPWCHVGPLKWWTRSNRLVLRFDDFFISKDLRRIMRKNPYRVTFDTAFDEVIKACAGRRKNRPAGLTWITPQIMHLYAALFDRGDAHSFEVWNAAGELVGGGYGISVGRVFYAESQFSHESNTSKMGIAVLSYHLAQWGYALIDGKDWAPTLDAMGFKLIPRAEFESILGEHAHAGGKPGRWCAHADLAEIAEWNRKPVPQEKKKVRKAAAPETPQAVPSEGD